MQRHSLLLLTHDTVELLPSFVATPEAQATTTDDTNIEAFPLQLTI
jgi:hypothetical protein